MNMTAIIITAIICITVAYISKHSGEGEGGNDKEGEGQQRKEGSNE